MFCLVEYLRSKTRILRRVIVVCLLNYFCISIHMCNFLRKWFQFGNGVEGANGWTADSSPLAPTQLVSLLFRRDFLGFCTWAAVLFVCGRWDHLTFLLVGSLLPSGRSLQPFGHRFFVSHFVSVEVKKWSGAGLPRTAGLRCCVALRAEGHD